MEQQSLTKNQIVEVLTRSTHGKLADYVPVVLAAAKAEPEFLGHLIAWNWEHGAIRDSKIALPMCSLAEAALDPQLVENSFAHAALLDPRNFVRALDFARTVGVPGKGRRLRVLVERYLRSRESSFGLWERAVIQHRASIKTLYAKWHIKPGGSPFAGTTMFDAVLFKGKHVHGSTLHIISQLSKMEPREALGHVLQRRIPFLVAVGALGSKLGDTDTVLALINAMSDTELVTNAKMLERLGTKSNPALRAAFRSRVEALGREAEVKTSGSILKTSRAAEAAAASGDEQLAKTLRSAQERQIKTHGGVKGRWLILGDKSGSMVQSIEVSRFVAGHLGRFAEEAHLVFFDVSPYYKHVTGWELERIKEETRLVRGQGGTLIHVGLEYIRARGIEVDGIAVISDGGDNQEGVSFVREWEAYCKRFDKEPTLYFFQVHGSDGDCFTPALKRAGISFELIDLRGGVDYYSLPNIIATMNTKRYGLLDQIMDTPLKTLAEVFGG